MLNCFPDPRNPLKSFRLAHSVATCSGTESSSIWVFGVIEGPAFGAEFLDCKAMGTDPIIAPQSDSHRYEAVLRISEAIAACREPEELARTLADKIGKFLHF